MLGPGCWLERSGDCEPLEDHAIAGLSTPCPVCPKIEYLMHEMGTRSFYRIFILLIHVKMCYTYLREKIRRFETMENQNVTLSIPRTLLKQAKIIAASQDKSLSQLMRESLEEKVREEAEYKKARTRQMRLLKEGLDLGTGGQVKISRDELHARG